MTRRKPALAREDAAPLTERQHQADRASTERYELRLYVAGSGPLSAQAIHNLNLLCEAQIAGRYHLEIIDIHQQPDAVSEASLIAAPTLVKTQPLPARRFIGNLAAAETVMRRLNMTANPVKKPR